MMSNALPMWPKGSVLAGIADRLRILLPEPHLAPDQETELHRAERAVANAVDVWCQRAADAVAAGVFVNGRPDTDTPSPAIEQQRCLMERITELALEIRGEVQS